MGLKRVPDPAPSAPPPQPEAVLALFSPVALETTQPNLPILPLTAPDPPAAAGPAPDAPAAEAPPAAGAPFPDAPVEVGPSAGLPRSEEIPTPAETRQLAVPEEKRAEARLALIALIKQNRSALQRIEAPVAKPTAPRAGAMEMLPPAAPPEPDVNPVSESAPVFSAPPPAEVKAPRMQFQAAPVDAAPSRHASPVISVRQPIVAEPEREAAWWKEPPRPASERSRVLIGAVLGAVALLGGAIYFYASPAHAPRRPSGKEPGNSAVLSSPPSFPLHLQAEAVAGGLVNVRWDPHSLLIAQARDGRLLITEQGSPPRVLPLSSAQLKVGRMSYQTVAPRVQFQLEVSDPSGAVATESVVAVAAAPAPFSSPAQGWSSSPGAPPSPGSLFPGSSSSGASAPGSSSQGSSGGPDRKPAPNSPAPSSIVPRSSAVPSAPAPSLSVPSPGAASGARAPAGNGAPRAFQPPPSQLRSADPQVILPEPPAISNAASQVPNSLTAIPRVAAPAPPPSTPASSVAQQVTLRSAQLIKRVAPQYPPVARAAHVQGTVRISATIGTDGRIKGAQVLSGPSLLAPAATDAVKQWIYQPTLLDGRPVEVVTTIAIDFSLSQ